MNAARRPSIVDSSVVVGAVVGRNSLDGGSGAQLCAPHLIDSEVLHALRRLVLRGTLSEQHAREGLDAFSRIEIERRPITGLLGRVWELRHTVTAYDAAYVALAEALDAQALLTTDARLARAPGIRCAVRVL